MTEGTQDEGEARMSVSACFALSQGIAPQVVMKWTGHSDYKAMKPYIDVADSIKAHYMHKLDINIKDYISF